jgi:hypothetical protein
MEKFPIIRYNGSMQSKTMPTLLLSPQVRMACSFFLVLLTAVATLFYSSFAVLSVFFSTQVVVKAATFPKTSIVPFTESLIIGPLKMLVATLMIGLGLPTLDSGAGLAWIGVALLFIYSGMQNMYWVFRSGRLAFQTVPAGDVPTTTRQQMKAEKEEDQLLADLFSSLDNPDSARKEQPDS